MVTIKCLHARVPKSESARNYTLNLQIIWVEQKCIFGDQMCSHILPTLQKSNKQECHYLDIQSSSLTSDSVFQWHCSPAPDRAATVPQCAFPFHSHLLPLPPSSPLSSHKCFNRSGGRSKESPLLTRTKMNCVRVQSFIVAWHEITALGFCQGGCQLVNYNSGRQDWDKQKIQWQLLHRTNLSGLVNTKIHCVNKDRQIHYAIVCYFATAKEQVWILENSRSHLKLICFYTWDDWDIK